MEIPNKSTKSFVTYWLPKERFIELARYARDYISWQEERSNLIKSSSIVKPNDDENNTTPIEGIVEKRAELDKKIKGVELAVLEASKGDRQLGNVIMLYAIRGMDYNELFEKGYTKLEKKDFLERIRAFYWFLDQDLKS